MGCLIILLVLTLGTLLAGPLGFAIACFAILAWALVTGSLRLLWALLLLPFRLLERLFRRQHLDLLQLRRAQVRAR